MKSNQTAVMIYEVNYDKGKKTEQAILKILR